MELIAIEEHWNLLHLTKPVNALPPGRDDPGIAFDEMGDNLGRLDDLDGGQVAAMKEQGVDLQILSPWGCPGRRRSTRQTLFG